MTALPPSSDFTGGSITEGQFKTAITSLRAFLSELLGTDGSNKIAALAAIGAVLNGSLVKAGAYTLAASDRGKVINASGTWTLSLTAAATLGDGFAFALFNNGSGTITIDPNGSELIDGATTKNIGAGKMAVVYCDGSEFVTVGSGVDSLNGQTGDVTTTSLYDIGSFITGRPANISAYAVGSTISGSNLYSTIPAGTWTSSSGFAATMMPSLVGVGLWRCVSGCGSNGSSVGSSGLWVRYA